MNTLETLKDILSEEFDLQRDQITPDAELAALGVDSLDLLELMFKIEDRYKLSIRDDIPTTLTTVNDVVVFVDGLLAHTREATGADDTDLHASQR
jgi:acyl carrier protein